MIRLNYRPYFLKISQSFHLLSGIFLIWSFNLYFSKGSLSFLIIKQFKNADFAKQGLIIPSSVIFLALSSLVIIRKILCPIKKNSFRLCAFYMFLIGCFFAASEDFGLVSKVKVFLFPLIPLSVYLYVENFFKSNDDLHNFIRGGVIGLLSSLLFFLSSPLVFDLSWADNIGRFTSYSWGSTFPDLLSYRPTIYMILTIIFSVILIDGRRKVFSKKYDFFLILILNILMFYFVAFSAVLETIIIYPFLIIALSFFIKEKSSLKNMMIFILPLVISLFIIMKMGKNYSVFKIKRLISQNVSNSIRNQRNIANIDEGIETFNIGPIDLTLNGFLPLRISPLSLHSRVNTYTNGRSNIWLTHFTPIVRNYDNVFDILFSPFMSFSGPHRLGGNNNFVDLNYRHIRSSHNFYLDVFFRFGLIGVGLFIYIILITFLDGRKVLKRLDKSYSLMLIYYIIFISFTFISLNLRAPLTHPGTAIIYYMIIFLFFKNNRINFHEEKKAVEI